MEKPDFNLTLNRNQPLVRNNRRNLLQKILHQALHLTFKSSFAPDRLNSNLLAHGIEQLEDPQPSLCVMTQIENFQQWDEIFVEMLAFTCDGQGWEICVGDV